MKEVISLECPLPVVGPSDVTYVCYWSTDQTMSRVRAAVELMQAFMPLVGNSEKELQVHPESTRVIFVLLGKLSEADSIDASLSANYHTFSDKIRQVDKYVDGTGENVC